MTRHSCRTVRPPTPESNTPIGRAIHRAGDSSERSPGSSATLRRRGEGLAQRSLVARARPRRRRCRVGVDRRRGRTSRSRWTTASRSRRRCTSRTARAPAGGWPAIVFLHGLGGNRAADERARRGIRIHRRALRRPHVRRPRPRRVGRARRRSTARARSPTSRAVRDWLAARPDVADTTIGAWGISYGGGAVWNSLVAGVPWAAVATVETWTDLYSGAHAAGAREVRARRRLRRLDPDRARRPGARRRPRRGLRRRTLRARRAVGRRALEHPEARSASRRPSSWRRAAATSPSGSTRRARAFAARSAARSALYRPPRPRAVDVPRGRHRRSHDRGRALVRPLSARRPAATRARRRRRDRPGEAGAGATRSRHASRRVADESSRSRASRRSPAAARPSRTSAPLRTRRSRSSARRRCRSSIAARGGWSRLVAVLTARTPAGKEIVVERRRRADEAGRADVHDPALRARRRSSRKGSRLTLTLALVLDSRRRPRTSSTSTCRWRRALAHASARRSSSCPACARRSRGERARSRPSRSPRSRSPRRAGAAPDGRPGRHRDDDPARRHGAAVRRGGRVRHGRPGREGVLRLRQREGRRERPEDRVPLLRRRVQPGADRPADAPARRAGQGVRGLQLDRHGEQPRDPRLPERAEGAAALRRRRLAGARPQLRAVPVDDGLPAELPRRGRGLRDATIVQDAAEGDDRGALREHRARQGHAHAA